MEDTDEIKSKIIFMKMIRVIDFTTSELKQRKSS